MKEVHLFDRKVLPSQEMVDAKIHRTQNGDLQIEMDAPMIRQYNQPTAKTIYPHGVELRFYGKDRTLRTKLTAKYAISLDDKKLMEARDSVVVMDYSNGDTIYLQNIVWDANSERIYSNNPLRAVNGQRVTYGDGFVSDEKMENLKVIHQRGQIEFNE